MAQILVRGLDPEVKERLQRRAARHGRSMEAEARDLLTRGAAEELDQADWLAELRARVEEVGGADLPIPARTEMPRVLTFD